MNAKKMIKGIVKLGIVSGIAYLAYKIGECNGEHNERVHQLANVDDVEIDDEFDFDEPDDGCISAYQDYKLMEYDKFDTIGYDENCDNGDHLYTRLRNLDTKGFSTKDVIKAAFTVMDDAYVSNKKLRDEVGISMSDAENLLDIFEAAGYVSEKDDRYRRKVYIKDMTLEDLL